MELAESSAAEMSVAEPVEEAELEQPGRAVQACRSEVTSPEAAARNRSRSRTAAGEPAPSHACTGDATEGALGSGGGAGSAALLVDAGRVPASGGTADFTARTPASLSWIVSPCSPPGGEGSSAHKDHERGCRRDRYADAMLLVHRATLVVVTLYGRAHLEKAPSVEPNPRIPCSCRNAPRPRPPPKRASGQPNPRIPCSCRNAPRPRPPRKPRLRSVKSEGSVLWLTIVLPPLWWLTNLRCCLCRWRHCPIAP